MSSQFGAEGSANAVSGAVDRADEYDQALDDSRNQLRALAEAGDEDGRKQRYWLYEHLWQLSGKANRILDEYEDDVRPSILIGDIVRRYFEPLRNIRADLYTYYWQRDSLMDRIASTSFDFELLETIREVRSDWQQLANAMKEFSAARQSSNTRQLGDLQLATGRELIQTLAAFARTLDSLVTTHGFETQAARLAKTIGVTPRRSTASPRSAIAQ